MDGKNDVSSAKNCGYGNVCGREVCCKKEMQDRTEDNFLRDTGLYRP